ncbi:glycoside hydrolase family 1 protein [Faecalicatena orotica]|uniref:glycoside hydrolase family 1 protein n=1 Tax=Faecalicatena orotica TaxID=1544 RepID=UPI003216DABE
MSFSKNFMFGAATAAHQVEGNNIHSDFWAMEHMKYSSFVEPSNEAVDHYHRYQEDILLMKNAGLNTYRFSIEWARIEPEEGKFDQAEVGHYREMLQFCNDQQITPIVTLHHFSSPKWLITKGGWASGYVVEAFAKYCRFVVTELGEYMGYICTINEANMGLQLQKITEEYKKLAQNAQKQENANKNGNVQVGVNLDMEKIMLGMKEQGEIFACDPRKVHTYLSGRTVEQDMIIMRAHQAAVKVIKEINSDLKVGLTLSLFDYQPAKDGQETADKLWNEDFGIYLPYFKEDDFLGVQNYSRKIVDANGTLPPAEGTPVTQMGYEDYPKSLGNVIRKVSREFKGDLIVTENGIATSDDERRCAFIQEALQGVSECIAERIPVKGYCYWSLMDNFEWQAGFGMTFGLIAVDRNSQMRYPKKSLEYVKNII